MIIRPLRLPGTWEIRVEAVRDGRGYFMRTYDQSLFHENGLVTEWVQENQSLSKRKGIIRGLHFQKPPHAETKLVRVVMGAVFDVFVDLRKGSATYGQWDSIELSGENRTMVYIPKGFAHGFCALSDEALVSYKVDAEYAPQSEGGLRWDDETLAINWPVDEPFLSEKDRALPGFGGFVSPFRNDQTERGRSIQTLGDNIRG